MIPQRKLRAGIGLLELLAVLAVVAILIGLAAPRFGAALQRMRARAALDQLTAEVYRARLTAVQNGRTVRLVVHASDGCVVAVRTVPELDPPAPPMPGRRIAGGVCIRHSGDSILSFNGRGMIRPPARSFHVARTSVADSVVISIAGRVRRNY